MSSLTFIHSETSRDQFICLLWLLDSFAEYRLFYRALLQKRPMILRSLQVFVKHHATHSYVFFDSFDFGLGWFRVYVVDVQFSLVVQGVGCWGLVLFGFSLVVQGVGSWGLVLSGWVWLRHIAWKSDRNWCIGDTWRDVFMCEHDIHACGL